MSLAIEFRGVQKRYGRDQVLRDVTFHCPPGTITAFCGPNGAGKSTALRILTGIARADAGTATVSGQSVREMADPARQLGSLLDASAFHPGRTIRETLRLTAFTIGEPSSRADDCAERVGLRPVLRRRVGALSLGMRQRLGIAHALLGDPPVLVLDEPSNGLDPGGIRWLDDLLRDFADGGGTVLLSTHQLASAERTADRVVALSRGRVTDQIRVDELRSTRTVVRADDLDHLADALRAAGVAHVRDRGSIMVESEPDTVGLVARDAGVALRELRREGVRLDVHLARVTDGEYDGTAA